MTACALQGFAAPVSDCGVFIGAALRRPLSR